MSEYAIIQLAGKQFKVSQGETVVVDRLDLDADKTLVVTDVLLLHTKKAVQVGTPLVPKAKVTLKVLAHEKGEKIRVGIYRAKSRYRKLKGHRQLQTRLEVVGITG